jgi:hypothetical protein
MTATGIQAFERARVELGALYARIMGRTIASVSDGDVVEYLSRGREQTKLYLKDRRKRMG